MDKPEGTPSGRLVDQSLPDFLDLNFGSLLPTYMRKVIGDFENPPEVPVLVGTDFSHLEARTVAMLVGYDNGKTTIHHIHDGDFFQEMKMNLSIIDEIPPLISEELFSYMKTHIVYNDIEPEQPNLIEKPVKQNGRDASYLAFDPTKKHKRRR